MKGMMHWKTMVKIVLLFVLPLAHSNAWAGDDITAAKWIKMGNRLVEEKKYDDAIIAFNQALEKDPGNQSARNGLGDCYSAKGDMTTAVKYYRSDLGASAKAGAKSRAVVESDDSSTSACAAGQADATVQTNKTLWGVLGCATNLLGVVVAYVYEPQPMASRLLGKSSVYVANYTDCFHSTSKSIQGSGALIGCGISGIAYVLYYVVAVASIRAAY